MRIHFSNTEKMKIRGQKVVSYSIPAGGKFCPGAKGSEVCGDCYAQKGRYRFKNVQTPRLNNFEDTFSSTSWENRMVEELVKQKITYLRLHDSGDIFSKRYASQWLRVLRQVPHIRVWIPTRSDKIKEIAPIISQLHNLPNVVVRYSNDNLGLTKSRDRVNTYVINHDEVQTAQQNGIFVCPVGLSKDRKSCDTCSVCYTDTPVAYIKH
jgi:hypothetical protein